MNRFLLILTFIALGNSASAQFHLGYGMNLLRSKPQIIHQAGPVEVFQLQTDKSLRSSYFLGYTYKVRYQLEFQLTTQSYGTFVTSKFDKQLTRYVPGDHWVPSLHFKYLWEPFKNYKLRIAPSIGLASFCAECTKGVPPYYLAHNYTGKSRPDAPHTGVYMNGWEAEYNPGRVYVFQAAIQLQIPIRKLHQLNIGAGIGKASTWTYRQTVHYENNGIIDGHDQYESAVLTFEQRHFNWSINLGYQLKLDWTHLNLF